MNYQKKWESANMKKLKPGQQIKYKCHGNTRKAIFIERIGRINLFKFPDFISPDDNGICEIKDSDLIKNGVM